MHFELLPIHVITQFKFKSLNHSILLFENMKLLMHSYFLWTELPYCNFYVVFKPNLVSIFKLKHSKLASLLMFTTKNWKKKISLSLILFFIIIFTNFLFEKKWKNGNLQRVLFCFSSLQKNLSRFYLKNLKIKLIMVKLKSFRLYFWQKNADYSAPSFSRIFTGFFFHSV